MITLKATTGQNPYSVGFPDTLEKGTLSFAEVSPHDTNGYGVSDTRLSTTKGYELRGACIYGVDDDISFAAHPAEDVAGATASLVTGVLPSDGATYNATFHSPVHQAIRFDFGKAGPKTKAYLILRKKN